MPLKRIFNFLRVLFSIALIVAFLPVTTAAAQPIPTDNAHASDGSEKIEAAVWENNLPSVQSENLSGYWVVFEQPDLSAAYAMDWHDRGEYVYDQLTAAAEQSQTSVRTLLDQQNIPYQSYWINNSILVQSFDSNRLLAIAADPAVSAVRARRTVTLDEGYPSLTTQWTPQYVQANISHVNADDVWAAGYTGEGITVGSIDTGVRYTHEALVNQYRGNLGNGSYNHNYNWWDPEYLGQDLVPNDQNGHGSHTTGTMVGSDGSRNQIGMAPGAQWIACQDFEGSTGMDADLIECAQFMTAPWDLNKQNANPDKRPMVVNNSWGDCSTTYETFFDSSITAWLAAGIYPVFSNGNASNCSYSYPPGLGTVGSPARSGRVTGVGSTGNSDGAYANHSNWGPTDQSDPFNPRGYPSMKPQVVAPGVMILSAYASSDSSYAYMTGTSMSAPHVSGLIALIWSAAPCLLGNYVDTETIIEESATPIYYDDGSSITLSNYPNFATGWGEINALAAVNAAHSICDVPTLTSDDLGGWVKPDAIHEFQIKITNPSATLEYQHMRVNLVLSTQLTEINFLKYQDGSNWVTIPLTLQSPGKVIGYYDLDGDFPLTAPDKKLVTFQLSFKNNGIYPIAAELEDLDAAQTYTLLEDTVYVYTEENFLPIVLK